MRAVFSLSLYFLNGIPSLHSRCASTTELPWILPRHVCIIRICHSRLKFKVLKFIEGQKWSILFMLPFQKNPRNVEFFPALKGSPLECRTRSLKVAQRNFRYQLCILHTLQYMRLYRDHIWTLGKCPFLKWNEWQRKHVFVHPTDQVLPGENWLLVLHSWLFWFSMLQDFFLKAWLEILPTFTIIFPHIIEAVTEILLPNQQQLFMNSISRYRTWNLHALTTAH